MKLFADGALGSHGALLLCPYCDRADTSGLALMTPEELDHAADVVHRAGLQLAIHAIGDLANRRALDAIQRAQGSDHSRRHRVEHAQLLTAEDIPRFAELGVVASMQPSHATSDMGWVEARVGRERLAGAYAWRRLKTSGALLAFGSDAPIEHENPWFGLHAAVTREARPGGPEGGWFPEQRLNLSEALDAFVSGPARAVGQDEPRLAPGARADLSVVDRDPFSLAPADLWRVEPAATWVDGFEVFRR
ncbi:MAG: amidohydrolase family protein [Myxococcales bacterium]|nr:amidohydrolase family protein [Myxococcales bacterium]